MWPFKKKQPIEEMPVEINTVKEALEKVLALRLAIEEGGDELDLYKKKDAIRKLKFFLHQKEVFLPKKNADLATMIRRAK